MKLDLIKKQIRKKALKFVPLVGVLLVVFIGAYSYSGSNNEKLEQAQREAANIVSSIQMKKDEYARTVKDLDEYRAIPANKLPVKGGYMLGRERLEVILPLIEDLKNKYSFSKLNFSLSEIKSVMAPGAEKFDMFENQISIDLSGATDEMVFSFINDLKVLLPGYLSLTSLKLVRENDIDNESAGQYISGSKAIVSASIVLKWSTLGKKEAAAPMEGGPMGQMPGRGGMQ